MIFFPANAARSAKLSRKLLHRLPLVSVSRPVSVVEIDAHPVAARDRKVENANREESVQRADRANALQGESDHHSHRVERDPRAHHARKESVRYARRESVPRGQGEPRAL